MKLSVVLPLLLPDEFTVAMSEFAIRAMRINASRPFELVVVETGSEHFKGRAPDVAPDVYVHVPERSTYVRDWNAGADAASGELLLHTGNDVFMATRGWDDALREPFQRYADCGISCISILEAGATPIGEGRVIPGMICEGWMTACMAFRSSWRLSGEFKALYSDADLLMRVYHSGKRAYRHYGALAYHLRSVTWNLLGEGHDAESEAMFYRRWRDSPLWAFSMLRMGGVRWTQEHAALMSFNGVAR